MTSSQEDDFFDDWDMSPSFEDRLFRSVDLAESISRQREAARADQIDEVKGSWRQQQQLLRPEYQSSFAVYRDPDFTNDQRVQNTNLQVLRHLDVNQQPRATVEPAKPGSVEKLETSNNRTRTESDAAKPTDVSIHQCDTASTCDLPSKLQEDKKYAHEETFGARELAARECDLSPVDEDEEDIWPGFDVNFESYISKLENERSFDEKGQQRTGQSHASVPSVDHQLEEKSDKPVYLCEERQNEVVENGTLEEKPELGASLGRFGGFMTAGSRKALKAGDEATRRALRLFENPGADDLLVENNSTDEASTTLSHQSEENKLESTEYVRPSYSKSGFTTGLGRPVKASSESAVRRAEQLLLDQPNTRSLDNDSKAERASENKTTLSDCHTSEPAEIADLAATESDHNSEATLKRGVKRPADDNVLEEFRYENILSQYGGFQMGNSKVGITVSVEAKRQAVALFNSDSSTRILTQCTQYQSSHEQESPESSPTTKETNLITPHPDEAQKPSNTDLTGASAESSSQKLCNPPLHTIHGNPSRLPRRTRRLLNPPHSKMKPFKSPVIEDKFELTKAAIGKRAPGAVRAKGPCVFNMNGPSVRQSLSTLGLPLQHSFEELQKMGISSEILQMSAESARHVRFGGWGPLEAREAMLKAGVLPQFATVSWVENHYRWIVWKIACMIRSFPEHCRDMWKAEKVLEQLLYRYEREVNMGHRSVLMKIIEHDDVAVKHMVLAVAGIAEISQDTESVPSGSPQRAAKYMLTLTDGWYQISAVADPRMERAIEKRKLIVGQKLSICGAQLLGERQPQSPLSVDQKMILSISSNGCRPVAWDTKLGAQKRKVLFRSLATTFHDGGLIPALDIIICRKYPLMYTEILENGTTITRTAREEDDIRRELQESQQFKHAENYDWMPIFHEESQSILRPASNSNAQSKNHLLNGGLKVAERKVSAFFKMKICDYSRKDWRTSTSAQPSVAMLLMTNANEINYLDICEGNRYRVYFLMPYTPKKKSSWLDIKTTRSTRWEPVPMGANDPGLLESAYEPRKVVSCDQLSSLSPTSEIDIVVLVIHASNPVKEVQPSGRIIWHGTLLVTDSSLALCQVKVRMPGRPLVNLEGQVLSFTNLKFDMYDSKYSITHLRTSDETETSINKSDTPHLQRAMQQLRDWRKQNNDEIASVRSRVDILLRQSC